jgi:hypothetical protein
MKSKIKIINLKNPRKITKLIQITTFRSNSRKWLSLGQLHIELPEKI